MTRRYGLRDDQWGRIEHLLPGRVGHVGGTARDNPLWCAERVRGEQLPLEFSVSERTIQTHMRQAPRTRPLRQSWPTLLANHPHVIPDYAFLQVTDLLFRPLFAFFIVERGSRLVVHVEVTRRPTDAWVSERFRDATPFGERPRFPAHDNDRPHGPRFAQLLAGSGVTAVRTPIRVPRANAITARFLRSVRHKCLDHLLLLGEGYLQGTPGEYLDYFN